MIIHTLNIGYTVYVYIYLSATVFSPRQQTIKQVVFSGATIFSDAVFFFYSRRGGPPPHGNATRALSLSGRAEPAGSLHLSFFLFTTLHGNVFPLSHTFSFWWCNWVCDHSSFQFLFSTISRFLMKYHLLISFFLLYLILFFLSKSNFRFVTVWTLHRFWILNLVQVGFESLNSIHS